MRRGLTVVIASLCVLLAFSALADQRLTVAFKTASIPADVVAMVEAAGGQVTGTVPEVGALEVTGPASLLSALSARNDVAAVNPSIDWQLPDTKATEFVEPSGVDTSKATYYNWYQWDIKQVTNNGGSFALRSGSHNTIVGIVDTGVSTRHAALKANFMGGRSFVPDGPNKTVVPTDIEDRNGHGSHVTGNIAGNGAILGVGPDLGYRSYRVFGATGGAPTARIAGAMIAAVNDGVDVISMSIGGYDVMATWFWTDPETGIRYRGTSDIADFLLYRRAVQYATAHGIVVVVAAGNEALNTGNPSILTAYLNSEYGDQGYHFIGATREVPGTIAGVVNVSATGPDTSRASYSNWGNAIDVSAPGGDAQRYPAPDYYLDFCLSANKGTNYIWMIGTSMATPKVSAVAALIIDQAKANGETLTPSQVIAKLKKSSIDLGKPGVDPFYGSGFVSAFNALQ